MVRAALLDRRHTRLDERHYVLPTGHIITGQVLRGNEQLVMPVAERLGDEMLASTA